LSTSGTGSEADAASPLLYGEVPFFLGVAGCPMYAVHHPPLSGATAATAVLIVPALGAEQLSGYRSEVLLARALARRGIHALRFHPRGQGDSGGESAMQTLATFAEDVAAARTELLRRAACGRCIIVGVRFGALAAAEALAHGEAPHALVLWEPVHEPAAYFRELLRSVIFSAVAQGHRSEVTVESMLATLERDGVVDVLGYPLHRDLVRGATRRLEDALAGWSGPTLLAQIDSRRSLSRPHASFAESLRARGAAVDVREIRSELSWYFLQNPAWESAELVAETADWIAAHA
jgi:pimeloyl-ACP methyl ester carboxylesterase